MAVNIIVNMHWTILAASDDIRSEDTFVMIILNQSLTGMTDGSSHSYRTRLPTIGPTKDTTMEVGVTLCTRLTLIRLCNIRNQ